MNKIKVYFREAYDELVHKVSWPSWKELQSSAIVVAVASLIIAMVIWLMDASFSSILKMYYNLFS